MKSLTKRTLLFILFISIPSSLHAAKSQKGNKSNNSVSSHNSNLNTKVNNQTTMKKDMEEQSLNTSHSSVISRKSQKIVVAKKADESQHSRSMDSVSKNQVLEETNLSGRSSVKSSPKVQDNLSDKSLESIQKSQVSPKDNDSHLNSQLSHDETRSPNIKIQGLNKSHVTSESNSSDHTSPINDTNLKTPTQELKEKAQKRIQELMSKKSNKESASQSSHISEDIQNRTNPSLTKSEKTPIPHSKSRHASIQSDDQTPSENSSQKSNISPSQKSHVSPSNKSHKSLDTGRDSINKSRSRYEKIGDHTDDFICKKNLMSIFSVEGNQIDQAIRATPREKAFCRRNAYTCCSAFNIMSINKYFGAGRKKLRQKFEVLEELLALFRGPKFIEYVHERKELAKCTPLVADMKLDIKGQTFGFFDLGYLKYQLEMAENLLMDTEIYVKKILWFYGDSICAICSPKVQEYFDFSDKVPKINIHINTCSERIEEREFERNLLLLYERFISKTMEFIQCTQGVENEEEGDEPDKKSESSEDETKEEFLPIDEEEKETFLETFDECWDDQRVANPKCQGFCKKSLRQYNFPINNLFHNFKVSLKIMYEAMTEGGSIEEYYENIKEVEWKLDDENAPIDFYPLSDDWKKYKMDEIEWDYHTSSGHNVFKEIMSKKFTDYEESVSRVVGFILIAFFALLK